VEDTLSEEGGGTGFQKIISPPPLFNWNRSRALTINNPSCFPFGSFFTLQLLQARIPWGSDVVEAQLNILPAVFFQTHLLSPLTVYAPFRFYPQTFPPFSV